MSLSIGASCWVLVGAQCLFSTATLSVPAVHIRRSRFELYVCSCLVNCANHAVRSCVQLHSSFAHCHCSLTNRHNLKSEHRLDIFSCLPSFMRGTCTPCTADTSSWLKRMDVGVDIRLLIVCEFPDASVISQLICEPSRRDEVNAELNYGSQSVNRSLTLMLYVPWVVYPQYRTVVQSGCDMCHVFIWVQHCVLPRV
jgi:hypothetical protein